MDIIVQIYLLFLSSFNDINDGLEGHLNWNLIHRIEIEGMEMI